MEKACLIVDDDPRIRRYLTAILKPMDFHVLEAVDATEAFKLVQELKDGVDLIVTDIRMPGPLNGWDLAFAVRHVFPTIPVILISGYGKMDTAKRPIGDFTFIEKPFKPEMILQAVAKAISAKGPRPVPESAAGVFGTHHR